MILQKNQVGDGVESVHFQDLMDAVQTDTVVVKIDIEGHECKVNHKLKLMGLQTQFQATLSKQENL